MTSTQQKHHLAAACYDRDHRFFYVFEYLVDDDKPLVHVWAVNATLPGACPDCSQEPVVLTGEIFASGTDCSCSSTTSITLGPGVTVQENARVRFSAPLVVVRPGFLAEPGSEVIVEQ